MDSHLTVLVIQDAHKIVLHNRLREMINEIDVNTGYQEFDKR